MNLLGRRHLLACGMTAALAAGVAGCAGATTTGSTVTGSTLTIYSSEPAQIAGTRQAQDVLAAEQLALDQAGGQVGHFKIKLSVLHGGKVSDNARTAIEDTSTIAYLGEIPQHASADSLGITNAQDVLQVTPFDTALELTQTTPALSGAPTIYYESLKTYGRTFGRVVPANDTEAVAQAREMAAVHVARLYVTDDGGPYGKAVAAAVRSDAAKQSIPVTEGDGTVAKVRASGADAVFLGASDATAAARLFDAIAADNPKTKLFGPTGLDTPAFAGAISAAAQRNTYISSPGFLPADLTQAGRKFIADFRAAEGRDPVQSAIFGYEAMALVLDVLRRTGATTPSLAGNRSDVVKEFFNTKNRASVLGTYSVNQNGDISIAPYVFSHFKLSTLVPFVAVQGN
jgi:branched-chain amino acid transport system substrate-binding protein